MPKLSPLGALAALNGRLGRCAIRCWREAMKQIFNEQPSI